jgi:DNA-binding SARP family transcriptional activator
MTTALSLFRGFSLVVDGKPVQVPLVGQRVLAFVALQGRPVLRGYVSGVLWPDYLDHNALANLRAALVRLRRCCPTPLLEGTRHLSLDPGVVLDVDAARSWERDLRLAETVDVTVLPEEGFSGDLLPDWYDEWLFVPREHLRAKRIEALELYARRLTDAGRYDDAASAGMTAVELDPLRESAHRAVLQAHLSGGNVGSAVRHYRRMRLHLRDALGIEPSVLTQQLMVRHQLARCLDG